MWLTALILGFAGSMHCAGMCSPLVMAVTTMKPSAFVNRGIYNAGRILTYGLLGAIVATAGMILPLRNLQNVLSILLGLSLVLIGLGGLKSVQIPWLTPGVRRITALLKKRFAHHLAQKTRAAIFMMGALNGILPCGLTFIALTWCLTLQGPVDGLNFMLLFGAGTLPVMLGLTGILPLLSRRFNFSIQKLTTSMLIFSGVVLIARVFVVHLPHTTSTHGGLMEIMMCR